MKILFHIFLLVFLVPIVLFSDELLSKELEPQEIVVKAIEHWRGTSSKLNAEMTVHRPDWERKLKLTSITKGTDKSYVRFSYPPKNAGSASLTVKENMWSFAPKINKVIKIPPSMMGQSWMGSDFSYKDLSRSDDITRYYKHSLVSKKKEKDHEVYVIQSIPTEDSPIVWGKELLKIRDDYIILEHKFFDQDMILIKELKASNVRIMDGKMYPGTIRMSQIEKSDYWTEIVHTKVQFRQPIRDSLFTVSYLRNPR